MGVHVLVVDDSTTIQKVIRIAFSRLDVSITAAASLIEALSEIHNRAPDVILADASLNGLRSVSDYAKLSAESNQAPVILLVGSYDSIDESALKQAGFPFVIRKPFESSDIIRKVGEVIGIDLENPQAAVLRDHEETLRGGATESNRSTHHTTIMTGNPRDTHILPPPPAGFVAQTMVGLAEQTMTDAAKGSFSHAHQDSLPYLPQNDAAPVSEPASSRSEPLPITLQTENVKDDFSLALDDATASLFPTSLDQQSSADNLDEESGSDIPLSLERKGQKAFDGNMEAVRKRMFQPPPPPPLEDSNEFDPLLEATQIRVQHLPEKTSESLRQDPPAVQSATPIHQTIDSVLQERRGTMTEPDTASLPAVTYKPSIDEIKIIIDTELRELIAAHIRESVEEYCAKQFTQLARDIITAEIRRLTEERSRLLVDN